MVTRVKLMEQQHQQQQQHQQHQQHKERPQNSTSRPYRVASVGSMAQDSKNVRNNINATTDRLLKPHKPPVEHCDNVGETSSRRPQHPSAGPSPIGSESLPPTNPYPDPEQTGDSSATGVITSDTSSTSKPTPTATTTKSSQGKTAAGSANPTSSHSPPPALQIYDIVRTIGKGNFAVVKLARHRMTRTEVAIKIIDKSKLDKANLEKVHREVEVMKLLDHPNIIKLYQVMTSESKIYIVSEYAPKGEIFDYIAEYGRMSEQLARRKFWQIIQAVDYCHQRRVVHRDLKAENLLLDADMNIKVADFGFSNFFKSEDWLTTWCGSPPYAAPEVFEGKKYKGPEIDIWSLGVVLYVLVCGALPFEAPDPPSLRDRVVRGTFKIPTYMSNECASLIQKMLVRDPKKRYTISMIKRDPWMRVEVPESEMHATTEGEAGDLNPERAVKSGRKCDMPINEKCIKIMGDLGIDTNATKQAVKNEVYNHHAAIYFLILDIYNKANKPGSSGMCSGKARHRQQQTITTSMGPPPQATTTSEAPHSQLRPNRPRPSQLQTKNPRASPSRHFSLGSDEVEHHGRRPSSVAEQVLSESNRLQIAQLAANHARLQPGNLDASSHPTQSGSLQPQTLWQASPSMRPSSQMDGDVNALRMQSPSGMVATEYDCNNCKEPILENTTSTTTCVKCARLRTRRRNFAHPTMLWSNQSATTTFAGRDHSAPLPQQYLFCSEERTRGPHDSRDSGVSTGSSQDYGECTPPIEKSLGFPRFPARVGSSDRPSVPISQVMRKLSEVEGIAPANMMLRSSVDEGVEFEHGSESALSDLGSAQARRQTLSHMASFDSSSLGSYSGSFHQGFNEAISCYRDSPGGSFTSTDSSYPYESFEDGLAIGEADLNLPLPTGGGSLPLPVSSQQESNSDGATGIGFSDCQGFLTMDLPSNYLKVPNHGTDRHLMRSPVHFREGRRASDGLLSQHMSTFNDRSKSQGYSELQLVHEEHRALQNRFGVPSARVSISPDGSSPAAVRQRKGNTVLAHRPSISKRISVPENFTYFPSPANQTAPGSSTDLQHLPAKQNLAHQLLQQRLQLKRHPSKPPRLFSADGSAANRRRTALSARQASKYSQQVAGVNKPYLPSQEPFLSGQVGAGVPGGEFLFQPIVEDEYGLDDLLPSGSHDGVDDTLGSNSMSSETQWHTLPSYMQQTCHLGQEDSPPPPAPPEPDILIRDTTETMDTLSPN
ncbi:serine/threonine-protein kinase par-1-like [Tigriopus californicus]|uniref:serine/threonine-protein kinase par-1-like n=1 Tax=Tigriopus californicus TaxID=6832 RepID=UPI0027DA5F06|nr:serine/threonine-protein kinase par-1-like [Tigriopus californicus]